MEETSETQLGDGSPRNELSIEYNFFFLFFIMYFIF